MTDLGSGGHHSAAEGQRRIPPDCPRVRQREVALVIDPGAGGREGEEGRECRADQRRHRTTAPVRVRVDPQKHLGRAGNQAVSLQASRGFTGTI
jgi:hypothetical protein